MSGVPSRRLLLIGVLVVLGVAVAIDRGGLLGESDAPDVAQRYVLVQAQLEQQRALIEDSDRLIDEVRELRETWDALRPKLVKAQTADLAPASVRDRVRTTLARAGVARVRVLGEEGRSTAVVAQSSSGEAVVPVRIRVSFEVADSAMIYAPIDAIDSARDLHARVAGLTIRGVGLNEAEESVAVTLEIDTPVVIGGRAP